MGTIEVYNCPFCGEKGVMVHNRNRTDIYRCKCTNPECEAQTGWSNSATKAALKWNNRVRLIGIEVEK